MQVQGLSAKAPTWPPKGQTPGVFDWGHPLGLAIVYANGADTPLKRFMDDGKVERLSTLPTGTYQAIAYHPSGLALGFIVNEGERQGIWLSDNEGKDPVRLVFSKPDTVFSSLAFSPDGTQIWWIAQHAGAISEIHWMDLADRTGFETILTRGLAPTAHGLLLAPSGPLIAATQGTGCADQQAMIVDADGARPAIPGGAQTDAGARMAGRLDAAGVGRGLRRAGAAVRGRRPRATTPCCWSTGSISGRRGPCCAMPRPRCPRRRTRRRRLRPAGWGDSADRRRPVGRHSRVVSVDVRSERASLRPDLRVQGLRAGGPRPGDAHP